MIDLRELSSEQFTEPEVLQKLYQLFVAKKAGFRKHINDLNPDLLQHILSLPGKTLADKLFMCTHGPAPKCSICDQPAMAKLHRWTEYCSKPCSAVGGGRKQVVEVKVRDKRNEDRKREREERGIPTLEILENLISSSTTSSFMCTIKHNYPKLWRLISPNELTPSEALYKFMYPDLVPACKTCGGPTTLRTVKKGYRPFCSSKCVNTHPEIKKKREETTFSNYGVRFPMQNIVSQSKQHASAYTVKSAVINGKNITYQGDELNVIKWLIENARLSIDDISSPTDPIIWYDETGKVHYHFCDLLVLGTFYIEVKSPWTLKNGLEINVSKLHWAIKQNLKYGFAVWRRDKKDVVFLESKEEILDFISCPSCHRFP
jgi:endogenous inhibitor of DNA gyrase (YacG/DUF329 family)